MDYKQNALEVAVNKATYAVSGTTVVLGLTANEVAAIGGLFVAIIALIVNSAISWHFKSQHLKLARERNKVPDCDECPVK